MRICSKLAVLTVASLWMGFCVSSAFAQSTNAELSGRITDPNGLPVPKVKIEAVNVLTNVSTSTETNEAGIYVILSLQPAIYRILVEKEGFDLIVKPNVELHVQDHGVLNFQLRIGSIATTVTVEGGAPLINTESAAVSTVVDRQFAENLPLNGRSFQTLIQLTPGVVLTPVSIYDSGQFSVNGQRADANYWTIDGVSANFGITPSGTPGNGSAGATFGFNVLGGTNSLVSVDALQEFRIQTSTYAPEFGRTPGGQISIVTRSGTNQWHGTLFDYLRNDVLDANDWFANKNGLKKPAERQNDFGGTFAGPILRDRSFFFFSYEGLRLRLPQVEETTVPCDSTCKVAGNSRAMAAAGMQPYLNVYPLPNGPEVLDSSGNATGTAQFNASFSNRATLDAYSLRIDHKLNKKLNLFGRYNYSPSELFQRSSPFNALNTPETSHITLHTATAGLTWSLSPLASNDLRINYSRNEGTDFFTLDSFGGAVPLNSSQIPFPNSFTTQNSEFALDIFTLANGFLLFGQNQHNLQRQFNLVDSVAVQRGSHSLKFGVDYRHLSPLFDPLKYTQAFFFNDIPSASSGTLAFALVRSFRGTALLFHNLGVFGQDTWRINPRLTLTYGLRWDVDYAPSTTSGPNLPAVINFNNVSQIALAPTGTPIFTTTYGNVAPRIGIAYGVSRKQGWELVARAGVGVFFDLSTQQVGQATAPNFWPFEATSFPSGNFPLAASALAPPAFSPVPGGQIVHAFDPNLELPYTLEWNFSLQQSLGSSQSISASYVGASGRRLIQTGLIRAPNLGPAFLVSNVGSSQYESSQLQYQRRLSHGLQALASYNWAHSIDTGSAGSSGVISNVVPSAATAAENRGASDFDIRSAFSAGLTYDVPAPKINALTRAVLGGWSLQNIIQARTAPPVDLYYSNFSVLVTSLVVRPDVVAGAPLYLFGSKYPGGRAFNPAAFTPPPLDPTTHLPTRQGDLGRNVLRGFGATQWDFAVHRDFPFRESLKLQFRAELFNVLNHPNFGQPVGNLGSPSGLNPLFGQSINMLGQSLNQNSGGGGFSALYQIGGPRSIQLPLKLTF